MNGRIDMALCSIVLVFNCRKGCSIAAVWLIFYENLFVRQNCWLCFIVQIPRPAFKTCLPQSSYFKNFGCKNPVTEVGSRSLGIGAICLVIFTVNTLFKSATPPKKRGRLQRLLNSYSFAGYIKILNSLLAG
jgi:hypothetical protein